MKIQQRPSLLALSALLLCTLHQTAGSRRLHRSSSASSTTTASPSETKGRTHLGTHNWLKQTNISSNYGSRRYKSRPSSKQKEGTGQENRFSFNTSDITVISERSDRASTWSPEEGESLCAYRVIEGGIGGHLCFRHNLFGYKCHKGGCRDFLLTELHENIPYRICLRSLVGSDEGQKADQRDCVEFTLPPSGMQDIVIAMTTVGGAICVMLVIICLLVAYITENIMSPTTQHTYYHTHSCH
ncbi:Fibronectin type-III domain-containing transmembrane protein [Liparis tanakae]|uniref:Fibronectin type-III domain-containing transmembrane protein n=1 Tax=Liparis tanakae TaxID=230148 RepID=A0A4Z2J7A8_9TELE|nr:Fibronectin type-III domain-containing transmembrane protein [Liparis tanakae]